MFDLSAVFGPSEYLFLLDALSDTLDFQSFPVAFLLPCLFTSQIPFLVLPFSGFLSLEYLRDKARSFLCIHSIGDLIQSRGFKEHLYTDDSNLYLEFLPLP